MKKKTSKKHYINYSANDFLFYIPAYKLACSLAIATAISQNQCELAHKYQIVVRMSIEYWIYCLIGDWLISSLHFRCPGKTQLYTVLSQVYTLTPLRIHYLHHTLMFNAKPTHE